MRELSKQEIHELEARGYSIMTIEELEAEDERLRAEYAGTEGLAMDEERVSYLDHYAQMTSDDVDCLTALRDILYAPTSAAKAEAMRFYGQSSTVEAIVEGAVRYILATGDERQAAALGERLRAEMPEVLEAVRLRLSA